MVQKDFQPNKNIIQLNRVAKTFKTDAGDFLALKNIEMSVTKGEFVAVIGKSGSGKTTLINMISGIDRPTQGEIIINNTPIQHLNENDMSVWRGRNLGIVFQFFQLLGNLTVLENVMLPMDFCNVYKPQDRKKKAMEFLDMVSIAQHAHKLPSMLSGGQQQRVAIARALANSPPIILADEPTGNLDSRTAEHVFEIFDGLIKKGKTIVMVTHDRDLAKRVNRTVIIADGEIIEEYFAHVFPALTQQQLVWVTSKMKLRQYHAGSLIIRQGEPQNKLYIVTKGKVEIVLKIVGREEFVVTVFGKGQYFGETELLRKNQKSLATVRAAPDTEVEVAELDRDTFIQLLNESKSTKDYFNKVAQARLKENISYQRKSR